MKKLSPASGSRLKQLALVAGVSLLPALAQAHHVPGTSASFTSGLVHPWLGLDHVLAMVAVGLWAGQLGGRSTWALPATFVGVMSLGGLLGMSGMPLPGVEAGILASVVVLGLLVARAVRLPQFASLALVGVFALFHGHAHGSELPVGASALAYGAGFVAATVALHALGLGAGRLARLQPTFPTLRLAGAAIALTGLALWAL